MHIILAIYYKCLNWSRNRMYIFGYMEFAMYSGKQEKWYMWLKDDYIQLEFLTCCFSVKKKPTVVPRCSTTYKKHVMLLNICFHFYRWAIVLGSNVLLCNSRRYLYRIAPWCTLYIFNRFAMDMKLCFFRELLFLQTI